MLTTGRDTGYRKRDARRWAGDHSRQAGRVLARSTDLEPYVIGSPGVSTPVA